MQWRISILAGAALIAIHIAMTFALAIYLQVGYYDTIAYLVSSKSLIDPALEYTTNRPPLYATILLPFVYQGDPDFAFRATFILGALFTVALLISSYWFLKRRFSPWWVFTGIVALVTNALIVHYGAFGNHDIPAALLFTLISCLYIKARKTPRHGNLAVVGVLIGLAITLRYNLGIVLPMLLATELYLLFVLKDQCAHQNLHSKKFFTWLLVLPLLFAYCYGITIFACKFGGYQYGVPRFHQLFVTQLFFQPFPLSNPWYEYLLTIPQALSLPLTACCVLGIATSLRSQNRQDIFVVVSCGVFLISHCLLTVKETRYILPIIVAIVYLTVIGLQKIYHLLRPYGHIATIAIILLMLPAVANALREWQRFRHPIFTTPYWTQIGRYIRKHSLPESPIYVVGFHTPLFPDDPIFHPLDEFYNLYSFGRAQLKFFGKRRLQEIVSLQDLKGAKRAYQLARQQAVAVPLYPHRTYATAIPNRPPSIFVFTWHKIEFAPLERSSTKTIFASADGQKAIINRQAKHQLQFTNLAPDNFYVYLHTATKKLVMHGRRQHPIVLSPWMGDCSRITLVFVHKKQFPPPGY